MWYTPNYQKTKFSGLNAEFSPRSRAAVYLIFISFLITGCASNQIGPSRPISIDNDVAFMWPLAYPDLTDFVTSSASARNQIVTARMYIADMEYHTYEANLTREMQDEGLLATAASLGLTTSATLVPAAVTKTLLSGIATGVIGLDKAYSEKELLSNAIQALQTQMRADRKAQAAAIYAKMFRDAGNNTKTITPITEYTLPMALSDADAYYQAGTIASALIGLSKTVANAETNAEQAKATAGPNPDAVKNANNTAAPMSSTTAQVVSFRNPSLPLPNPQRIVIPPSNDPRYTQREQGLLKNQIQDWQRALCIRPADGKLGDHNSPTRHAIRDYLRSLPNGGPIPSENSDASLEIRPREEVLLNRLVDNPKTCQ